MKITQRLLICMGFALLSVPALSAQNLSKYRNFSLGESLAAVSKQAGITADQVKTVHQEPKLIQQFTLWTVQSFAATAASEPVQEMEFSFCDGKLYNIEVTYKSDATKGLTSEDMIQAVSVDYGVAAQPAAENNTSSAAAPGYNSAYKQLAVWQDPEHSVALFVSPLSQSFQLVMIAKPLEAEADAAIAEAEARERADAPQRENARLKQEADDLQSEREANRKAFHP